MSRENDPATMASAQPGDVLVSHPPRYASTRSALCPTLLTGYPTHDAAVSDGCSEADGRGVDAWLTEDQTHVVKIASHRTPDK
jgi:hypothetical protein